MLDYIKMNLQLFAAGTLVNATTTYVNSDTGATTPFDGTNKLSDTMKTYYDTELLENARSNLIFAQFGKKQGLPANKGRTIEWRKWNTLPNADTLTPGRNLRSILIWRRYKAWPPSWRQCKGGAYGHCIRLGTHQGKH